MIDDTQSDHPETAAGAEREAEDLKRQGDKLQDDIEATKSEWERKQDDASVPGAVPDPGDAVDERGETARDAAD